jgi:hypothetical protein
VIENSVLDGSSFGDVHHARATSGRKARHINVAKVFGALELFAQRGRVHRTKRSAPGSK